VNIEHVVGERQQMALEVVRDLLGDRPVGPARKDAIQVTLVDRRGARARAKGRIVHGGHDDDAPAHLSQIQLARQVEECDRSLIFVAVIGAGEQRRRSLAALDDSDGNHDRAPGGIVA
jgi:hypothetical protein